MGDHMKKRLSVLQVAVREDGTLLGGSVWGR